MAVNLSNVDEDMQSGIRCSRQKDGTFEIKSVGDGNYAVTVWGLESNWFVKSVRIGGDDVLEKGLQLERGSAGRTIEVVISTAARNWTVRSAKVIPRWLERTFVSRPIRRLPTTGSGCAA